MTKSIIQILGILCLVSVPLVSGEPRNDAENVCNEAITVRKDHTYEVPVTYEIPYKSICGILPCTKTNKITRMDQQVRPVTEIIRRRTCCPGYAETPSRDCAPVCLNSCNNGKCVQPNICKCNIEPTESSPGYVGSTCDRFVCLAVDRWGSKCDRECNCPPHSYCSASTGKCLCRNGWRGANCTEECTSLSGCTEVELPPIVEPEVNMIPENLVARSQRLEAASPRSMEGVMGADETNLRYASNCFYFVTNLALLVFAAILLFLILRYKKRLTAMRSELNYMGAAGASSAASSGSDSYYESPYYYKLPPPPPARNEARPRLADPDSSLTEAEFLGKNLSFAAATRDLLQPNAKSASANQDDDRSKVALNRRVESRLIVSQQPSQKNVYSDISHADRSANDTLDSTVLNLTSSSEEHIYQVPRSTPMSNGSFKCNTTADLSENADTSSCLYEEIKPRPEP